MSLRKFNIKFTLFAAYFLSIIFIAFPPFLIATILFHRSLLKKEKNFYDELRKIGFNNYREVETGQNKYLIFNDDGRFIETLHHRYKIFDIRDYNVEFNAPNRQNQVVNMLVAQKVAGDLGVLAALGASISYLILRKKGEFSDSIKYSIAGQKSIETLANFLFYYKEKGFIS